MVRRITFITSLMIASLSFASQAGDYNNSVPKDEALMAQKINQDAILNAHPTDAFGDKYNPNPSETAYYGDDDSAMNQAAQSALASSDIAKTAHRVKNKQPSTEALENSSFVKSNKLFFTDAYNVAHGISDDQIDCENGHTCHFVFEPKSCEKTIPATIHCNKTAIPHTKKTPYQVTVTYKGQLSSPTPTTGIIIPPENGVITSVTVSLYNYGNNIYSCFQNYWGNIGGLNSNRFHPQCGGGTDGSGFVFTNNGLNVNAIANQPVMWSLHCDWGGCSGSVAASRAWTITMQVTRYKEEAYITWGDTICP